MRNYPQSVPSDGPSKLSEYFLPGMLLSMFCFTTFLNPAPTCIVHRVSRVPRICCKQPAIYSAIGLTPVASTTADAMENKPTVPSTSSTTEDPSATTIAQANGGNLIDSDQPTEFVILGSGVSTGLPRISCIIRPTSEYRCTVCHDALNTPDSKNRRCNVSALIRAAGYTVLIDCGKTIRESTMRHFPALKVRNVDAIVLTHGHADAILGLDDARDIQMAPPRIVVGNEVRYGKTDPIPVYLNQPTMDVCKNVFPYLMPSNHTAVDSADKKLNRRVSRLNWQVYTHNDYFKPFKPIPDVPIHLTPVPMYHGGDYICMGYVIHVCASNDPTEAKSYSPKVIAYLSDVSALPEETMAFVTALPRIDLLVVDMLSDASSNIHFSRTDAIKLVRQLRPVEAVAVGMTCSLGLHDQVNEQLAVMKEEGLSFRLAYDGERFPCNFHSISHNS